MWLLPFLILLPLLLDNIIPSTKYNEPYWLIPLLPVAVCIIPCFACAWCTSISASGNYPLGLHLLYRFLKQCTRLLHSSRRSKSKCASCCLVCCDHSMKFSEYTILNLMLQYAAWIPIAILLIMIKLSILFQVECWRFVMIPLYLYASTTLYELVVLTGTHISQFVPLKQKIGLITIVACIITMFVGSVVSLILVTLKMDNIEPFKSTNWSILLIGFYVANLVLVVGGTCIKPLIQLATDDTCCTYTTTADILKDNLLTCAACTVANCIVFPITLTFILLSLKLENISNMYYVWAFSPLYFGATVMCCCICCLGVCLGIIGVLC